MCCPCETEDGRKRGRDASGRDGIDERSESALRKQLIEGTVLLPTRSAKSPAPLQAGLKLWTLNRGSDSCPDRQVRSDGSAPLDAPSDGYVSVSYV